MSNFLMALQTILRNTFTGKDNKTHDIGAISWGVSAAAIIGLAAWQTGHHTHVAVTDLAYALTAISAGHGLAMGAKANTQP